MNGFHIKNLAAMRAALAERVIRTPVIALQGSKIAPLLPQDTAMCMKLELFQHTGSFKARGALLGVCLLYTSPSPRDVEESRMPSSA